MTRLLRQKFVENTSSIPNYKRLYKKYYPKLKVILQFQLSINVYFSIISLTIITISSFHSLNFYFQYINEGKPSKD